MEYLMCDLCDAGPFRYKRALSTHKSVCLKNKRQRQEQHQVHEFPSTTRDFGQSSEPPHPSEIPQLHEVPASSEPHDPTAFLDFNLDEPTDDLEIDDFSHTASSESSEYTYDSTFSLINWIRTCKKGGGLSNNDIEKLFKQVLFHPSFKLEDVSVKSAHDVQNYEKSFYSEADGWKKVEIEGHVLNYREPILALESLFSSPAVAENFTLKPLMTPPNEDVEPRKYSTPATGNWWRSMQEHVNCEHGEGKVVAPLILYSDKTSLSKDGKVSGHPIYLSIANIACEDRYLPEGHCLLALLPDFSLQEATSLGRLRSFQKCLSHVLQPLKDASFNGISLFDPFGNEQTVYPRLYAYVCDHPEGCKVTCTYDTNQSRYPCSMCMCQKLALVDVERRNVEYRTEHEMKRIYGQMSTQPRSVQNSTSKSYSLHPVECALWNFAGGNTVFGNPYLAINIDMLHQADLGIFKTIMDILQSVSKELTPAPLPELDKRLLQIKEIARFFQFRVPGTDKGGYFTSNANFAAFEHRCVMQVVVFCMLGLFPNFFIEAIVNFLQWYQLACRSKEFSEESLAKMDDYMQRAVRSFTTHLGVWQKSNFNLVKIHAMKHYSSSIRRSGAPIEYSSNMYEHLHIALVKTAYRASNKKQFLNFIVKYNRRLEALRMSALDKDGYSPPIGKNTTLDMTLETGQHILAGFQVHVNMALVDFGIVTSTSSNLEDVLSKKERIMARVLQPDILINLKTCLETYMNQNNLMGGQVLQCYRSLALCPGESSRYGETPMFTRATSCFHGKEWFGSISIKMEGEGEEEKTSYGQLRLLFKCNMKLGQHDGNITKELCLVRMYEELELHTSLKCPQLKWVEDGHESYKVIEIASILKAVHIIPHFERNGHFL